MRCHQGDITKLQTDAIVNAANTTLLGGGGVDGAIHRAAGPGLLAECRTIGGCPTGEARITRGYRLPAKYVIHAVGPVWSGGQRGEAKQLAAAYRAALQLAADHHCRSVALPALSTGAYRYPLDAAARVAVITAAEFLDSLPDAGPPQTVRFVLFSADVLAAFESALEALLRAENGGA